MITIPEYNPVPAETNLCSGGKAFLKKGEGRALKAGGSWIYNNEIERTEGRFEDGDIIEVFDFDGYPLGYGFYNSFSVITIRMMSRRGAKITPAFIKDRVKTAWEYRKRVIDTSSCRVIFGEADFLPGLVVDKFTDVLVAESLALGIDRLKPMILTFLLEVLAEDGIEIRGIYERSDAKVRAKEGMKPFKGFIGPEFDTKVEIVENGVHYLVDVKEGQKTGFFLDQKNNRALVGKLCPGKDVLDCFTHTGSFALNAACSGASHVLAADISELAIAQAKENAALNHVEDHMDFHCGDVFALLTEMEQTDRKFDVVILDPPAFTKSREATKNAIKGYRDINMRGMRLVKDGGYLATCSCSHFMTQELFAKTIGEAAKGAHKRLRQVSFSTQAPDHPILWAADESYYLKFLIFQVCEEK